jgi:saccharopine dehydrogenase-like NADP-dependent oxidoreductase
VCAKLVAKNPKVDEVVLADLRTENTKTLCSRSKDGKFKVAKVDARDPASLRKVLRGCDVFVSAIPSEMNLKVMLQALDAGANYVDFSVAPEIIDDFKKYRRIVERAGVTAITGMGADPGLSDVFARYGANKLDSAHEAHVRDGDNGVAKGVELFSLWSPLDMMEEVTINAAVFKDGKIEWLPPLHKKEVYPFPEPIGPLPVYNTTHEETFMIPMFIKGIRNADFKIAVDDEFVRAANMIRKLGMHSLKEIDVKGVRVRPLDVVVATMPTPTEMIGKVRGSAGIVVEVLGKKDGKKAMAKTWTTLSHEKAYRKYGTNATGYLVGAGGSVGADLILNGDVCEDTLFVPELLPPEKVLEMLPERGLKALESLTYI